MNKNIVVANWKMNPSSLEEARVISSKIEHGLTAVNRQKVLTVICPPFVFLPAVLHTLHFARLGAQDISAESAGAFTGQVSATQLKELRVRYAIIGHSERRALGEDNKLINRKIHAAIAAEVRPILCVGDGTKKNSSLKTVQKVISAQLKAGFAGVNLQKNPPIVAYEPVWAIGSGQTPTAQHAAEAAAFIKKITPASQVLYGGSMNGANASDFAASGLGGGLVGGASLKPNEFLKVVRAFA